MLEKTICFDSEGDVLASDEIESLGALGEVERDPGPGAGAEVRGNRAVVSLMVKLERMARSDIPPEQRLSLLKAVEPSVLRLGEGMPKPVAAARHSGAKGPGGQTLEQRLYCLTAKNLKITLASFDRSPLAYQEGADADRSWLVRHLFELFGREIEYSVRWDRPWPPFMWQELHDLFFYLSSRKDLALGTGAADEVFGFDPEHEYKRLLLLGLVKLLVRPADRSPLLYRGLSAWARGSSLKEAAGYGGTFDLFVVEMYCDEPPRQHAGSLDPGFNGWVLEPAAGFLDYVAGLSAHA
jgi:hypothetical protein